MDNEARNSFHVLIHVVPTLGGMSGSPLLGLDTEGHFKVVGVHYCCKGFPIAPENPGSVSCFSLLGLDINHNEAISGVESARVVSLVASNVRRLPGRDQGSSETRRHLDVAQTARNIQRP